MTTAPAPSHRAQVLAVWIVCAAFPPALAAAGLAVGRGLKALGVRHAAPAVLAPLLFAPPFSSKLHAWIRGRPCPYREELQYRATGLAGILVSVVVNAR